MNKKDAWIRRQQIARRGHVPVRRSTPYYKEKQKKRKLIPKFSKWGDQSHLGTQAVFYTESYKMEEIRDGHEEEKKLNRNRKNFRMRRHKVRDKRNYWDHGRERKREKL